MANAKERVRFTELWALLPESEDIIWKQLVPSAKATVWGEIIQLLCGALWHLELASKIGDEFFPVERVPDLFKYWLESRENISAKSEEGELIMSCSIRGSVDNRLKDLIQSMLLADGTLRIAGIRQILIDNKADISRQVLQNPNNILDKDGELKPSCSEIQKHVLIIVAFRDSFMHGERKPPKYEKEIATFREKWITMSHSIQYNLAVIASACREVWKSLAEIINENRSSKSTS